jgi:hypothetical protein
MTIRVTTTRRRTTMPAHDKSPPVPPDVGSGIDATREK